MGLTHSGFTCGSASRYTYGCLFERLASTLPFTKKIQNNPKKSKVLGDVSSSTYSVTPVG